MKLVLNHLFKKGNQYSVPIMDFKQFAKRMIVILEKRKIRTNAFYQCVLCETVSQSEINPIYTSNWSWLKDDDYLCHHCSYHVSLLASLQQQV